MPSKNLGPAQNKEDLLNRLKKIEGQVRGVYKMVDEDRYCVDILTQVAAIRAAVTKLGMQIMENHTRGCMTKAIKENQGDEAVNELMDILMKFVK